jgi:hypothetical protein
MKIATLTDVYSANDCPVAVILTKKDRENIANMHPEATVYAAFPDDTPIPDMQKWVEHLKAET